MRTASQFIADNAERAAVRTKGRIPAPGRGQAAAEATRRNMECRTRNSEGASLDCSGARGAMAGDVYRRQSALRTISGGICCGLCFRLPRFAQLLLLGYQRTVNSLTLKGNLFLFNLPNITNPFPPAARLYYHPPPIGKFGR